MEEKKRTVIERRGGRKSFLRIDWGPSQLRPRGEVSGNVSAVKSDRTQRVTAVGVLEQESHQGRFITSRLPAMAGCL